MKVAWWGRRAGSVRAVKLHRRVHAHDEGWDVRIRSRWYVEAMRRLGSILMTLGAMVGVGTGVAVLTGVDIPGVGSWLVAVAVAKLGFIAAFALIAAGAMLNRIAARSARSTMPEIEPPPVRSADALTRGLPADAPLKQRDAVKQERRDTP